MLMYSTSLWIFTECSWITVGGFNTIKAHASGIAAQNQVWNLAGDRLKKALCLIPFFCKMPWPVLKTNRDISGVGVLKGAAGAVKLGWQWRIRSLRVLPYMTFVTIPSWITSGLGHILISEWLRDTVSDRGDWYLWTTGTNLTLLWLWVLRPR